MAQPRINVGPLDARAPQAAGVRPLRMCVGILFAMGGFKDGTAAFGYPLLILSVLDAWLPIVHKGYWGLIAGAVVAIGAFQTARTRQCPINGLLGVNTAQGAA